MVTDCSDVRLIDATRITKTMMKKLTMPGSSEMDRLEAAAVLAAVSSAETVELVCPMCGEKMMGGGKG